MVACPAAYPAACQGSRQEGWADPSALAPLLVQMKPTLTLLVMLPPLVLAQGPHQVRAGALCQTLRRRCCWRAASLQARCRGPLGQALQPAPTYE